METTTTMTKAEEKLKRYLDGRASTDKLFAKAYAKEGKTFEECIRYIKSEAYKAATKGMAFCTDEEVYGMAVHYYDEDSIEFDAAPECKMTATDKKQKGLLTEEDRQQAAAEAKRQAYEILVEQQREENRKALSATAAKAKKQPTADSPSLFNFDEE